MRKIELTGTIYDDVVLKTFNGKNGENQVTTIRFYVRDLEWNAETQRREWQTVLYCEAGAFGKTAEIWAEKFKKGDVIEVDGIASIRTYQGNDGTIRATQVVSGPRGGAAEVEHCPRQFAPREEQAGLNDESYSQEPPF